MSKQSERDQEKARRKQERLERHQTAPKHVFEDSTAYTSQLQDNMDSIDDALQKGYYTSFLSYYCKLIKCIKILHNSPLFSILVRNNCSINSLFFLVMHRNVYEIHLSDTY